jgi:hypothetical protein
LGKVSVLVEDSSGACLCAWGWLICWVKSLYVMKVIFPFSVVSLL